MKLFFLFSFLKYATAVSIYASADTNSTNFLVQTKEELHRVKAKIYGMRRYIRSLSTNFGPDSTYQSADGKTCYVCRPGFYKMSDCLSNGTIANCKRCPDGMYSSTYNIATRCANCSRYCLDKNAEIHTVCNSTADMTCRCKSGFYNHSKGSGEYICLPHSQCPVGQEMLQKGTPDSDTMCRNCQPGTFSSDTSLDKCKPCTPCTSDQIVTSPCDGKNNVVCEPKGNTPKLQIVIPSVISALAVIITIVIIVIWRKGKLENLKRCCFRLTTLEETMAKSPVETENYIGGVPDISTFEITHEDIQLQKVKRHTETWTSVFTLVKDHINVNEWKDVIRTLLDKAGDKDVENTIDAICCHDYRSEGVKEHIYQCLRKWLQLCGEATLDDILEVLMYHNMFNLADKLQKKFPSLLKDTTGSDIREHESCNGD